MRAALAVLVLLLAAPALAQTAPGDSLRWRGPADFAAATDSLELAAGQQRVELGAALLDSIVAVRLEGVALPRDAWRADLVRGLLALDEPAAQGQWLVVRYLRSPLGGASSARLFDPARPDSAIAPAAPVAADSARARPARRAGPSGLDIRGSKTVSVQGGSNRDATVDQGLRLSVGGELSPGLRVRAEISDENLPVTPEGNTEELGDLDQVRIELYGPRGSALVGDFELVEQLGEFAPYRRKLQGLRLSGRGNAGVATLLGGSPRGRRIELELRGREGVQGPYELLDPLRLDQSFIVAGTERVWLDGELLRRGEGNGYTIDYVRGTITFTELVPIGADRRIAVDFEASDNGYARSVVGARADSLRLGPVRAHLAVLREADDAGRPRSGALDPADLDALAAAGDSSATGGGARQLPPGEGDYVRNPEPGGGYSYALADSGQGEWEVDFLFVGEGAGAYELEGVDELGRLDFRYVGPGNGRYRVGRTLPVPVRTQLAVGRLEYGSATGARLSAEVDLVQQDRNTLSPLDDDDNQGHAWRVAGRSGWWGDPEAGLGLRLDATAERIGPDYVALGRLREPFFYELWNLQQDGAPQDEQYQRAGLELRAPGRRADLQLAHLGRGSYDGWRGSGRADGKLAGPLFGSLRGGHTSADREGGRRSERSDGRAEWRYEWKLSPFGHVEGERSEDRRASGATGLRRDGWGAGLRRGPAGAPALQLAYERSEADSLRRDGSGWRFAREVQQWSAQARRQGARGLLEASLHLRDSELAGGQDEDARLGRLRARRSAFSGAAELDLQYRVGSERSRVLGRQVVFVGFNQGDFDAEGNPVGPRQGDYNVVFTPTDSTVASTEVGVEGQLDLRLPGAWWEGARSSTRLSLLEQSTTDDVGALLRLDPGQLREPGTTLLGEQQLRQELQLLRDLQAWDLRLELDERLGLDQRFRQGPVSSRRRLRQARLEHELRPGVGLVGTAGDEVREREDPLTTNPLLRGYELRDRFVRGELRWRPTPRQRLSLELGYVDRSEERAPLTQQLLELRPSATTGWGQLRLTASGRLVQVSEEGPPDPVRPFFLERPGTGRSLELGAQWGGKGGLDFSVRYQLRDEAQRPVRHDLAVESRARF